MTSKGADNAAPPDRPRLVLTSTFPVHPRVGGGQQRTFYLCRGLSRRFDVEIISLTASRESKRTLALAPGLVETIVPKSPDHEAEEARRGAGMPFPVSDILTTSLIERSQVYLDTLRDATAGAAGAILEHPYMYPALEAVAGSLPIFYDAQNVEVSLKSESLRDTTDAAELIDIVRRVESAAVSAGRLVFHCTEEDRALLESEFRVPADKFVSTPNGVDANAIGFRDTASRHLARDRWFDCFRGFGGPGSLSRSTLFIASLHGPNIDAAGRLMRLAVEMPGVLFLVAGSICDYYQRLPVPLNVVLLGIIPESTKVTLLTVADVGLNPMVQGSGSNLKMLDYMASGMPVLTTQHGSRGLHLGAGIESIRVAPIEDFASALRDLLEHPPPLESRLEARRLVERDHDWVAIGSRVLEAVLKSLDMEPLVV